MSVFTPHPSAPASVRVIQRTMIIQVVYVLIFAALNQSHRGDYGYYQPSEGLIALQVFLGVALLGCAFGIGQLASWSLPVSIAVEVASLALGIYSLVDSKSGLAAGFIIAGFNLYRLAQSDAQRALKAGPQAFTPNPYAGQQFPGQPYGSQAPYGGQPPYGAQAYGAPQAPYGASPYGATPGGTPHPLYAAQPPAEQPPFGTPPAPPATDYFGNPIRPDSQA